MAIEKIFFDVVQPASCSKPGKLKSLISLMTKRGFYPLNMPVFKRTNSYLAGSDRERYFELKRAFESKSRLVICLRGGYGSQRLLPLISTPFSGKIFLGYSDITALQVTGVVRDSIHGCWSWLKEEMALEVLRLVMNRQRVVVPISAGVKLEGIAVAGNLSILTDLLGTKFLKPPRESFVLFLEDTGEEYYRLDRMFFQLFYSGFLEHCVGIGLGYFDFKGKLLDFDRIKRIVEGFVKMRKVRIKIFHFPFGHSGGFLIPIPQFWRVVVREDKTIFLPR
ncbi:MAG: LD-carboxypeptidase [Deltaproteobacteria bacterium]|nr:LD-carboxypeptidase [Deltaproteobacteria bacterium]